MRTPEAAQALGRRKGAAEQPDGRICGYHQRTAGRNALPIAGRQEENHPERAQQVLKNDGAVQAAGIAHQAMQPGEQKALREGPDLAAAVARHSSGSRKSATKAEKKLGWLHRPSIQARFQDAVNAGL